jgi:hypothetical protein
MTVLDEELEMLGAIYNDELTVITAGKVYTQVHHGRPTSALLLIMLDVSTTASRALVL